MTTGNDDLFAAAAAEPQNQGEMPDADAVGTVGSPECGDMVRMWLKFTEKDGKKVIDRASFQSFGCQTALAVASLATQLLKGKTVDEAKDLSAAQLAAPIGALPPMKIHCGQMVEGALKAALEADAAGQPVAAAPLLAPQSSGGHLGDALGAVPSPSKIKITMQS